MKKIKKNKKGFTLVELIVVITVLAILAAIAIPIAGNWVTKAKTSSDVSNIALFQSAIEKYVADGHKYPTTSSEAIDIISKDTRISTPIAAPQDGGYFVFDTSSSKVITASAIGGYVQISG